MPMSLQFCCSLHSFYSKNLIWMCMTCKSDGKKHGNKKVYIIHSITKTKYKNLKRKHNKKPWMETQHPVHKNPSFKVNLHTSEDQNQTVKYLHNAKHTKLGHDPYIVRFVINLNSFSESFLFRVYTSFVEL